MKTRLTINHDYLTLRFAEASGFAVNCGYNRSGPKTSITLKADTDMDLARKASNFFFAYLDKQSKVGGKYVDILETLKAKADKVDSVASLMEVLA